MTRITALARHDDEDGSARRRGRSSPRLSLGSASPHGDSRTHETSDASRSIDPPLRWCAAEYRDVQRRRIALGEQIRAVVQGRATGWPVLDGADAEELLAALRRGEEVPVLGLLGARYSHAHAEELEVTAMLRRAVHGHPAWPWLEQVKGIGEVMAGRLLGGLEIERARRPSSFWRVCGLATVPASWTHETPRDAERADEPTTDARVPQRFARGPASRYSRLMRVECHLVGVSLLRRGGRYRQFYQQRRAYLASREGWPAARQHHTALRMMEKLFLVHLWLVWREAAGLDTGSAHPAQHDLGPWDMVG